MEGTDVTMLRTPTGGAGRGTATADRQLISIGAVLSLLRDEFPEVTISKIRFLESEGLVEPQRTPSGYRKFSPTDVERLAYVLRMQRDHYLPLRVIREHLDALDRGESAPLPAPADRRLSGTGSMDSAGGDLLGSSSHTPAPGMRLGRAELLAATGVSDQELDQWESYGLVRARPEGGYDTEALDLAKVIAELGQYGLEPRHLRSFKAAADREVGMVEQIVAPLRRHRNPQTRAHAESTARQLAALVVRLHAALVQSGLRTRVL